jgi:hypothetical protein
MEANREFKFKLLNLLRCRSILSILFLCASLFLNEELYIAITSLILMVSLHLSGWLEANN